MKISKIDLKHHLQFQDLTLDLTYPKGHPKAGQALDKVCLIGQSGTGKTTLLNLIYDVVQTIKKGRPKGRIDNEVNFTFSQNQDNTKPKHAHITISKGSYMQNKETENININKLLYFPAEISAINIDYKNDLFDSSNLVPEMKLYSKELRQIWKAFYYEVKAYQDKEANYRIQLTQQIEDDEDIDIKKKLKIWREEKTNPLEKVAKECLDKLLSRFYLSVDTKTITYNSLDVIKIISKATGNIINFENLSSGTKQLIYTAFPIYQLLEDHSVVLIDQPEDSLYPDVQQAIIPYYTSFDKNQKSQFFFATHSPIVASAFEPWEIVELKFDSEGKIYREFYYDSSKENHVDHYHTDPRYLRWDSILTEIFDLEEEGNTVFRSKMLMEFAILKRKIEKLEKEGKLKNQTEETKKIIAQYKKAGTLLAWETKTT